MEQTTVEEEESVNIAYISMAEITAFYERAAESREKSDIEMIHKKLSKETIRLAKALEDLNFLISCRNIGITPKFLKIRKKQRRHDERIKMAEQSMVRNEISFTRSKIAKIEEDVYKIYLEYASKTSELRLYRNMRRIEIRKNVEKERKKLRHRNKTKWWLEKQKQKDKHEEIKEEIGYKNLSNRNIDEFEHKVLNYGPKHVWKSKPDIKSIIPEVENVLQSIEEEERLHLKNKFCDIIRKQNLRTSKEETCLKKLKRDEKIRIIKADKSNKFVIYDAEDYKSKVTEAINKLEVKKLDRDPTEDIMRKIANIGKLKYVPDIIKKGCKIPELPAEPKMFMQAKIHKTGNPLRQMVSKRNTITYNLEKAVAEIIEPTINKSNYTIKSTIEARNRILSIADRISDETKLFSMDVEALYPSINMQKVKRLVLQNIRNDYSKKELKTIESTINLIIEANFFKLENKYYKQGKGAPIGSPVSAKVAEVEMQTLENNILTKNDFNELILYIRFVDDILVVWNGKTEDFENSFVKKFNQYCTNINFTIEKEENNILSFLDMKLERKQSSIEISIHRKESGQREPIHFESEHPIQHKIAGLYSNLFRAYRIPSTKGKVEEEVRLVEKKFRAAKYPEEIINRIDRRVKSVLFPKTMLRPEKEEKKKKFIAITYYKEFEEWYRKIKRNLKENVKLSFRTPRKAEGLCITDRDVGIPRTGVYSIPIHNNQTKEIMFYIGQTKRLISTRLKEHKESLISIPPKTKIAEYIQNNDANAKWEETEIIYKPRYAKDLIINEAIEIFNHERFVINEKRSDILDKTWIKLLIDNRNIMNKKSGIYKHIFEAKVEQPTLEILCSNRLAETVIKQRKEKPTEMGQENMGNQTAGTSELPNNLVEGAAGAIAIRRRGVEEEDNSCTNDYGLSGSRPKPV